MNDFQELLRTAEEMNMLLRKVSAIMRNFQTRGDIPDLLGRCRLIAKDMESLDRETSPNLIITSLFHIVDSNQNHSDWRIRVLLDEILVSLESYSESFVPN